MPIEIQCSGCSKTLKAKDSLAGKRVKCPACHTVLEIPQSSSPPAAAASREEVQEIEPLSGREASLDAAGEALHASLLRALDESRLEDAASILRGFNLWMVSAPGSDEYEPLIANLDELDALVVFTSQDFVREFAAATPELAEPDGSIGSFAVDGPNVFAQLQGEIGLLVNPESDNALLLDAECVEAIQAHLSDPMLLRPTVEVPAATPEQRDAQGDPEAVALRRKVMSTLHSMGFYPAEWLPLADLGRELRPQEEIAGRLLALAGVFAWASAPPDVVSGSQLSAFLKRSKLGRWVTESEREILALPRPRANAEFAGMVGWRLENMWPLAWVLGYERQPEVGTPQIDEDVIHSMLFDFIGGFDASVDSLLEASKVRSSTSVNALEDYFYGAHNAVRSAQFGSSDKPTVPAGFDPIADGGVIHERRHALTWCLSPGIEWDETDLST